MILETWDDVMEYWCEVKDQTLHEMWAEFKQKGRTTVPQHWTVMGSSKFIRLVRKAFAGTLDIEDRQLIDDYCKLILHSWVQLCWNTELCGHTELSPLESLKECGINTNGATLNRFCDWIDGDAISDYGLRPISELLVPMFLQKNYSLKVQIMADIIGITHQRGDLARFFVEDGRRTHAQIDVYEEHACY